jgi:hypothetical protein
MVRIFVVIIGSFELPCYRDFIRMRKLQLEKYNIPHLFLFDGEIPDDYILDPQDRVYLKEEPPWPVMNELNTRHGALNPHMVLKFLKGIREIDDTQYDYILRINLSTFINFPKLINILEIYPKQYFTAGHVMKFQIPDWRPNPHDDLEFIAGTCMVFSSDVVGFFKSIPLKSYILYEHNDDVVLSFLAKLYVNTFVPLHVVFLENYSLVNTINVNTGSIYRIKCQDRNYDIKIWKELLKLCDTIHA